MSTWKYAWLLKPYYVEYLSKIPREEWIDLFRLEVRPMEDLYPWSVRGEELPCHGKKIGIESRDGEKIQAILYRPEKESEKLPVYFHIHGGSFHSGCAEVDDYFCIRLQDEVPCLVVSIDYRLAPEYPFPTPLNDCYDVVKYFADHEQEYGIDTDRMSIGGEDAGGALATGICIQAAENSAFDFRCLLLNCPSLDHSHKNVPGDTPVAVENYVLANHCYCDPSEAENPLISPIFATPEQLQKMPSTVLITAEKDHEAETAEAWAVCLQRQNVEVTVKRFMDVQHHFTMNYPAFWGGETAQKAIDFLAGELKRYLILKYNRG